MPKSKRERLDPLLGELDRATVKDPLTAEQKRKLLQQATSAEVQDPDHHAVNFPLARWADLPPWNDRGSNLDTFERLSRGQVVEFAEHSQHDGDWLPTLGASYTWGAALAGYGPYRMHEILQDVDMPSLREKLQAVVDTLQHRGPVAAYDALSGRGEGRLRIYRPGPAFFTKFLYFAGRVVSVPAGSPVPLILDRVLAGELRSVAHERVGAIDGQNPDELALWAWAEDGWSSARYATYLHWAEAATESLRSVCGAWPRRLDAVEVGLFLSRRKSAR